MGAARSRLGGEVVQVWDGGVTSALLTAGPCVGRLVRAHGALVDLFAVGDGNGAVGGRACVVGREGRGNGGHRGRVV